MTKTQASVRTMTEDEMMSMVLNLASKIQSVESGEQAEVSSEEKFMPVDAKKSIKEKSITCLECGKSMKVLTKRHLAIHGLDAVSYREKW